ncbi:MAG: hypothetical protein GTO18_13195 [Anaerolineales bacterium]|nr:hypothetical protein [Anaerolineales bacterium]
MAIWLKSFVKTSLIVFLGCVLMSSVLDVTPGVGDSLVTFTIQPSSLNLVVQRPPERESSQASSGFTFALTADMRNFSGEGTYDTSEYFRGAVESMESLGVVDFMISPGDIDPTENVHWTITQVFGVEFLWYPIVGNHELPGAGFEDYVGDNMNWLRTYEYGVVNAGPSGCPTTTFSFDVQNAHFIALNEYCDAGGDTATSGDITDHLYNWLSDDLNNTEADHIFVIGHEPAYPQPDADNDRMRHEYDSLNQYLANRDRFWSLLQDFEVLAYLCGHTHNYSVVEIDGIWQMDVGHARGVGDTGARSTYVLVEVDGEVVSYKAYRDDANGGSYTLMHSGFLSAIHTYIPFVTR